MVGEVPQDGSDGWEIPSSHGRVGWRRSAALHPRCSLKKLEDEEEVGKQGGRPFLSDQVPPKTSPKPRAKAAPKTAAVKAAAPKKKAPPKKAAKKEPAPRKPTGVKKAKASPKAKGKASPKTTPKKKGTPTK